MRYLLGVVAQGMGDRNGAREAFEAVAAGTDGAASPPSDPGDLLGIAALRALGRDPGTTVEAALARVESASADGLLALELSLVQRALAVGEPPERGP